MQKAHETWRSATAPGNSSPRRRSMLSPLFMLSLGIIYPGFLALIFLKPELLENLFNTSSGYVISGLGLALLGLCFGLATAHFRAADREYRQMSDTPPSTLPISNKEALPYPSPNHRALSAHKHNHPGE